MFKSWKSCPNRQNITVFFCVFTQKIPANLALKEILQKPGFLLQPAVIIRHILQDIGIRPMCLPFLQSHDTRPLTGICFIVYCLKETLWLDFFYWLYFFYVRHLLSLLQDCFCCMFWFLGFQACGILAWWPGSNLHSCIGRQNVNHWIAREAPWTVTSKCSWLG